MQSSLTKRVIVAFGVALSIVATLGVIQYADARRLIQDSQWVAHTHQALGELEATLNLLTDAEMSARAYVITGRESYVDSWGKATVATQAHFQQLHSLMSDNSAQQHRLAGLEPLLIQSFDALRQAVDLRRNNDASSAREIIFTGVGRKALDDIRALIGEMKNEELGLLRERNEAAAASNRHTTSAILYGSFTALLLLALAGLLVLFDVSERNRAERELARERDLLHLLMDNIPDFIYFKDAASRFTRINRAQADALGVARPEDAVGKTDFDFFTPEHAQEAFADELQILRTGRPLITKVEEASRRDGTSIWVSTTKMQIQDVQGTVIGTFGVSRDITKSKLTEEASRLLAEVTAGANSAEDMHTAMARSLETICKLKGWQVGQAWLLEDGESALFCAPDAYHAVVDCRAFRKASLAVRLEKGVGLPGRVWESNAPAWVVDVTKDENFPRAHFARELGLKSAFAFSIRYGQTLFGVFEFFASEIREPDRDFLEAVDRLGARLGDVFGRKRAEAALRASEERFRAVAETANDAILSADQHGNIIHWNKGAERTFGYSAAETLGKPLTMIMPERFHVAHQRGL
jgi:PAS domain S-box-containing protein